MEVRKLNAKERLLVDRLTHVLESDHPTTEELAITLEITPEDIIERFPDRIYDLREKIVDTHIIFGETDDEMEEGEDPPWDEEEEA